MAQSLDRENPESRYPGHVCDGKYRITVGYDQCGTDPGHGESRDQRTVWYPGHVCDGRYRITVRYDQCGTVPRQGKP